MKYPIKSSVILDVTKPPYCADNTGKTDCTKILKQIFDDVLRREIEGVKESNELLNEMSEMGKKTVYDGFENRVYENSREDAGNFVLFPRIVPPAKIIYFPKGTYLVSDTITYTFDNLQNIFVSKPLSELNRNIHIMGEDSENTVIKLKDNCEGFGKDSRKPVLNFVNVSDAMNRKCSNVCQDNTLEDISIDCGSGNDGAVGVRFLSINSGRISNLNVYAKGAYCGIETAVNNTASIVDVKVSGFEFGMSIPHSSITVLDRIDLSQNTVAAVKTDSAKVAFKNVDCGNIPALMFAPEEMKTNFAEIGVYHFYGESINYCGEKGRNEIYYETKDIPVERYTIPLNHRSEDENDWALVDDFGAVPDGKTDSTEAIQAAFNSGKSVIIFGSGHYLVDGEIKVPATVKTVDFMYTDFFSGDKLVHSHGGALFDVNEESEDIIFFENLYTFEQFHGFMRLIKHSAKRDLVMRNIHTQASSTYFNTVGGSRVWLDNCAATTGSYAHNCVLTKETEYEDYSYVIPYEFHNQEVYAMQLNPERAHIEVLNDNSDILMDAYKIEGPGIAVKTINGGRTNIHICLAAIGYIHAENALFDTVESDFEISGMIIRDSPDWKNLRYIYLIDDESNGVKTRILMNDVTDMNENDKRLNYYNSNDAGVIK